MTRPLPELGKAYLVTFDPPRPGWSKPDEAAMVVDMGAISSETLDVLLLPDEYKVAVRRRARKA